MNQRIIQAADTDQAYDPFDSSLAAPPRVLIADDDAYIRQLLELTLEEGGYEVISAINGHELVKLAQQRAPHLILVDLMMPEMDGYEAIRQMRNDTRTAHIPMLILTARTRTDDLVTGFETGADDYIPKPFDIPELLARVKSHLRRAARQPVLNPLSGLPGSTLIAQEIRHRLENNERFALLYADLDSFKTFNDTYGFSRGDRAILMLAAIVQRVIITQGNPDDFIGHIGGDDFAVISTPDRVEQLCRDIISAFEHEIAELYHPDDWRRGYLSGVDRYGVLRRFKLMSISIGVVTTQRRSFTSEEEMAQVAAEMKRYAKAQNGNRYAIDQRIIRVDPNTERRGVRRRVTIMSNDASLRSVLRATLYDQNCVVYEFVSADGFKQWAKSMCEPHLIVADAQLGPQLWTLLSELPTGASQPSTIVLFQDDHEIASAPRHINAVFLRQPLPLADVIACVERLMTGLRSPATLS
jgi:diguanylate cyclase (GGDEF)-like protein